MEDEQRIKQILTENKWLIDMWKEFEEIRTEFFKKATAIEKKYQKKYNKDKEDIFFAWLEGDVIGIDWKDTRAQNKGAMLIHDSNLNRFDE